MNKYWTNREIKRRQHLLDSAIDETEEEIRKAYKKVADRVVQKLENEYKSILVDDRPYKRYEIARLYKILGELEEEISKLNKEEVNILDEKMRKLYEDISKTIDEEMGLNIPLQTEKIAIAVTQDWVGDGLTFSNRFAQSNEKLMSKLQELLTDAVTTGESSKILSTELLKEFEPQFYKSNGELLDSFSEEMQKDLNQAYKEAERLIRTELAHIEITATMERYKDAGIKLYRWLTANDSISRYNQKAEKVNKLNTEEYAKKNNGQMIPESRLIALKGSVCTECLLMEEQNVGYGKGIYPIDYNDFPPKHPNCRCTILSVRGIFGEDYSY